MKKELCFLFICALLLSVAACSTLQKNTATPETAQAPTLTRTYPSVVNPEGVELYVGMSSGDFEKALQVDLEEDAFFVNPTEGLRTVVHDGQIIQIEIYAGWMLKNEPGLGDTKDAIIALHGEPQTDGEAISSSNQQQIPDHYLMAYAVEDGIVAYTYNTENIVDCITIRGVDNTTFNTMIAEWQTGK